MNTKSMHVAERQPAPIADRGTQRSAGSRHGRQPGSARTGLMLLFVAITATVAAQGRADVYQDFNRAVATDDARTVSRLIERGMDPNTVNEKGEPALVTAAREGSVAAVNALIRGRAKLDIRTAFGDTPIMVAALGGNLPVVKLLRQAGAQINHPGWTPLLYAAVNGHDPVIEYLLSSGADMGLSAPNGATPLMLAVSENKAETVRLLLSYGFDVSARNDKGETALTMARRREFREIEQMLRQAGARQ